MVSIGEAHADRLVDEENIRVRVPRLRVKGCVGRARHSTRTKFHEEANRRGPARAAVSPEDDIVGVWVPSTLEEVEEEVLGLDVNVACVRASRLSANRQEQCTGIEGTYSTVPSQNLDFLTRTP